MAISRPCYASRDDVKRALDFKETARSDGQIDRALESASDDVEGYLHRRFYPELTTRSFDWPNRQYARSWRLWLDGNEIIAATALVSGGVTLAPGDFFLRRSDDLDEPPYTHVEINLDSSASFTSAGSHQRAIALTGVYGYTARERPAGALAEALDASETSVDVTDSAAIGVGNLVRVDSERMLVTGRRMLDTGQNLAADLAARDAATTVAVADGTGYAIDEVILVDSERMLIIDVAGNNLAVKRGWDGSTLAAHSTGADVYAPRTLLVDRGALGTTAATHSSSAAVARHQVPGLIRDLCVAETIDQLLQETSGYARRGGVVDNSHNAISTSNIRSNKNEFGLGIDAIRNRAYTAYGRKARKAAV